MEEYVVGLLPPGEIGVRVATLQAQLLQSHGIWSGQALPIHLPLAASCRPLRLDHPAVQPPAAATPGSLRLRRISLPPLALGGVRSTATGLFLEVHPRADPLAVGPWSAAWLLARAAWPSPDAAAMAVGPGFLLATGRQAPEAATVSAEVPQELSFSRGTLAVIRVSFEDVESWWEACEWEIIQTLALRRASVPDRAGQQAP